MPTDAMTLLVATLTAPVVVFTLLWVISLARKDASVVDWYWGLGFAVIGAIGLFVAAQQKPAAWLLAGLVTVWALRLTVHLVRRHAAAGGLEDPRYTRLRAQHAAGYWWKSYFLVFLVQAVVQWLVASPLLVTFAVAHQPIWWVIAIGTVSFAVGFIVETVADAQLAAFKVRREKDAVCDEGLWRLCRHPNYLGEMLVWIGIGTVAFGATLSVLAFFGPALLCFLLLRVSGIPPKEAHMAATKPGWSAYAQRTPALLPWPRRPRPLTA